ncbi:hypothetical protein PV08_03670 [Exophiala spinifera]|uniref:Aldehyde dehydrogenase domain-containing protein n=1 Tax=Exophiala spinifera TaxID=91928 RepID=A0A0D2BLC2_9EURO|nr:uncharacterized protein PV08_03670 [Exophiala spinifera]KIW19375.1 hypothetical protein PV08_03670 [Exophiala spinifera]
MAEESFSRIQTACLEGRAQSVLFRQRLFHSLYSTLKASASKIKDAIVADTGHNEADVTLEYTLAISELRTHYDELNLEEDINSQHSLENLNATTSAGIIYLIPSKHNLFYSVISALTASLAAGNCVVVELPMTLTHVSGLLRKILPSTLDADVFAISSTRPPEAFLSKCQVVSQVEEDTSSAKVVAIVDRSSNVPEAASIIGTSRVAFNGRAAYAPDIVLVNEFVAEDFLFHLVQAVTTPPSKPSLSAVSQQSPKAQSDGASQIIKELEGNDGVRVVMSGASCTIVDVKDRYKSPLGRRMEGRVVLICRTTSLDDAIDLCNGLQTPLQATYVFAAPTEANYLSRFTDARISCANHIPTELLVGPFAPQHRTVAPSPSPRYLSILFRSPRPRLAQPSNLTSIFQEVTKSRSIKGLESWARSITETPLPAIKQADGRATGFFDQAFMVVGSAAVIVLTGSAYTLFRTWRR